jgi:hypothetical protein
MSSHLSSHDFVINYRYSNFRPATAPSLIQHVRDIVKHAPRELYLMILLTAGPPSTPSAAASTSTTSTHQLQKRRRQQNSIIAIHICFTGSREKGGEIHDMIRAWDNGQSCLMNDVGSKLFLMQTGSIERMLRGVWGRRWFLKSDMITSLSDDVIQQTVQKFDDVQGGGCESLSHLSLLYETDRFVSSLGTRTGRRGHLRLWGLLHLQRLARCCLACLRLTPMGLE